MTLYFNLQGSNLAVRQFIIYYLESYCVGELLGILIMTRGISQVYATNRWTLTSNFR